LLVLLGVLTFMGPCIVSIFQYISNKMQRYTFYLYLETALYVSGGTSTHHQERIQLYLQHLVFVTQLLLSAAIVEELEPVWVCCGWRTAVSSRPAHKTVVYIEWHIPDVLLIQFFWWWAHRWPKHVFFLLRCYPTRVMASSFLRFLDHKLHSTIGRTPLDEWSARRRNLYLTTHNIHKRQTSMPPVGSEPTISAGRRPQTNVLERATTGTGARNI
jgi:hypothetical protein